MSTLIARWNAISPWVRTFGALLLAMFVVGAGARALHLDFPNKRVFDEVYFPIFAGHYIAGTSFYDVHPPLGKFVIALGMLLLGDEPVGWRIMPLLFGFFIPPLMGLIAYRLTQSKPAAWGLAACLAVDGIFIAYSRTGLMDGILFTAIFLSLWSAVRLREGGAVVWTAVALGVAISIKWTALATIVPMIWYAMKAGKLRAMLAWLPLSLVIYIVAVVAGQWRIGASDPVQASIEWHRQALTYHASLNATHSWASDWWSWPIMLRPVLFLHDVQPDNSVQVMTTLASPVLLWSSTLVVIGSIVFLIRRKREAGDAMSSHPLFPLLLGYFASWLPYAPVSRVMFFYHYLPAYGFALLIGAWWFARLWESRPKWAVGYVALVALAGWYWLPFAIGYPKLERDQISQRLIMWSWLYKSVAR